MRYDHNSIESQFRKVWEEEKLYLADDGEDGREKKYVLDMFPYPSGAGLHVGHPEGYTATDIVSRKWRMQGKNVLHPMGWDAFGLPAENYAIKTGTPPALSTQKNIETFTEQIKSLGFSYDWTRELATCNPEYYTWTQWWFSFLYKQGLAYRKEAAVNWDPVEQTVLANEQVVDGRGERSGALVEQRLLKQWFFKITDFIEDTRVVDKTARRFVLLHGFNGTPEGSYFAWLRNELEQQGYEVVAPQLPDAERPDAAAWMAALDGLGLDEKTVVVGHSLGAAIAVRWMEARRKKLYKVVLTAVPMGDCGIPEIAEICSLPVTEGVRHLAEVELLHSTDDAVVPYADMERYGQLLGVPVERVSGYGHFDKGAQPEEVLRACTTRVTRGLLAGLEKIDWPESTKIAQRNWIGRSEGAEVDFTVEGSDGRITVFTTRVDTLYGVTYVVLAPEHELVARLVTSERADEVAAYQAATKLKTALERQSQQEKTGVWTGGYAVHPLTGEKVPVWVADYVLAGYGTGAVMGVPAHDERDFEFARKYGLPVVAVVSEKEDGVVSSDDAAMTSDGFVRVGGDMMTSVAAREALTLRLEKEGKGKGRTTYRLRDWLVSRQRYWGAPIPVVYDAEGGEYLDEALPVLLPTDVDYKPKGKSPLSTSETFHAGLPAGHLRECDTMDTFVCSSWYFFRFADAKNGKMFADPALMKKWLPVDVYVGGAEHTVLHLLYSRFFMKVAHRNFLVDGDEPFLQLRHQGMILGENGEKMSKSKGNVINPDDIVKEYGADTLRVYEMFMGPFEGSKPWSTKGALGVRRFLEKVLRQYEKVGEEEETREFLTKLHKTIDKVTRDIDGFHFNTAVSALMIFVNYCDEQKSLPREGMRVLARLIAPLAPFLAEELWRNVLKEVGSVHMQEYPVALPEYLVESEVVLAVQVNGKLRGTCTAGADITQEEAVALAKALPEVQKWLTGEVVKEIYIPGKMVSLVVR